MLPDILKAMKQGGDQKAHRGYTMVEVMIVLAVTSLLFTMAILVVGGRQSKTQFMTAINNAQQQIQQIVNETQSGFFTGSSFKCQGNTSGSLPAFDQSAGATDHGCVFLGKVMQFGTDSDHSQLIVYPIVGNQQYTPVGSTTPQQVDTLPHAYPVYPTGPGVPATQQVYKLESGLNVYAAATSTGAAGFMTSLASYSSCGPDTTNTCLNSGSQQFSLYKFTTIAANISSGSAINLINAANATNYAAASSVTVCLASGTTSESGLITISGNGSLAVSLDIRENTTCA